MLVGARAVRGLAALTILFRMSGGAEAQAEQAEESYVGSVLLSPVHANLDSLMERPFGVLRFSQAAVSFLNVDSTVFLRSWVYLQAVAVGLGDRERTPMDMFYFGAEDGRFVGFFSETSYTERGRGHGMATDLPWAPYTLANTSATLSNVNAVCTGSPSPCRGESNKSLAPSPTCTGNSTVLGTPMCDLDSATDDTASCLAGCAPGGCPGSWASRSGSCTDKMHEEVDAANEAACLAGPEGNTWFAPCVGDCCDNSIRNYYKYPTEPGDAREFTRWRNYDPRHRTWYKQQRRDYLERNLTTGWSSMYEFTTSQALGLSAMAVAANPSSGELLGVFAIDCKCNSALLPALSPS